MKDSTSVLFAAMSALASNGGTGMRSIPMGGVTGSGSAITLIEGQKMPRRLLLIPALLMASVFPAIPNTGQGPVISDAPPAINPQLVLSPHAKTSVTIAGKKVTINYSAPSMRKRVIFGGLEPYGKVWRAGANDATLLTTEADLDLNGLKIPKGKYSLFVWLDPSQWQLIVNKQTGMSGLEYDQKMDLGRVPMAMSKPPKPIEKFRITLSKSGSEGKIELAWENVIAGVGFIVQ